MEGINFSCSEEDLRKEAITGESFMKLLLIMNTAYSQLLSVHHCATFSNLKLKTPGHLYDLAGEMSYATCSKDEWKEISALL